MTVSEYPVNLTDPRIGIEDLDLAALTASVLSEALVSRNDRGGTYWSSYPMRLLHLLGHTPANLGFKTLPAPSPDLPDVLPIRTQRTVWRELNTGLKQERHHWDTLVTKAGPVACLPIERLCRFVPAEFFKVMAAVIADGPGAYKVRCEAALIQLRDQPRAPKKRRPNHYCSQSTLQAFTTAAGLLIKYLSKRALVPGHPAARYLDQWRGVKVSIETPTSRAVGELLTDRGAPPSHLVRRVWAGLDTRVRELLGVGPGADELAAIRKLPADQLPALHSPLRMRAMITVLALLGTRIDATLSLNQADVVAKRRRPGVNAGVGPAIRVTPYKTKDGHVPRWKFIPEDAAAVLEAYRLLCSRWAGPLPPQAPFFLSSAEVTRWSVSAVRTALSGDPYKPRKALLPIDDDEPHIGYNPHSMRYLTKQWISSTASAGWLQERGEHPDRREVIGEALLDHSVKNMPALYRGDSSTVGLEKLSYLATQISWIMLTTEEGARRVPDGERYREVLMSDQTLAEELDAVEVELQELCAESEQSGRELSSSSVLGRIVKISSLSRKRVEAQKTIVAIEAGLATKPIADDVPDEDVPSVDIQAIKTEVTEGTAAHPTPILRRIRNWLTPEEFAHLIGRAPSSVRQWVTSGHPGRSGAWDPADPPIIAFNSRRRAIFVEGLNQVVLFNTHEKRQALAQLLAADPPSGWSSYPLKSAPSCASEHVP